MKREEAALVLAEIRQTLDKVLELQACIEGMMEYGGGQASFKFMEPEVSDTARYPIGETARLLGISRDTLRRHTENGLIKCGYNRVNKRRFYLGAEIKRYWKKSF